MAKAFLTPLTAASLAAQELHTRDLLNDIGPIDHDPDLAAAIAQARAEERAWAASIARAEEELDGLPTPEQFAVMRHAGFIETCRAIVRATKRNIAEAIERGH